MVGLLAIGERMRHVISLSGGLSSAVAAERVIERYGKASVALWFADTLFEDEDLHRFMAQCIGRWGIQPVVNTEGRTPLQVAYDKQLVPNDRMAPCSAALKIVPFTRWLKAQPKPITVHIGMDWWEGDRQAAPRRNYEAIAGVTVDFPLSWKPLELRPYEDVVRSWGIEPPRLYALGFSHNNCGGRCVRQGIGEWQRLWVHFPERFKEMETWEQAQRERVGPHSFTVDRTGGQRVPITLVELRERWEREPIRMFEPTVIEDRYHCRCETEDSFAEAAELV